MEKDMNKTAENRCNAAESAPNGGIEYSAFENMDRLAAIFAMQKLLNDDIAARRGLEFSVEEWEQRLVLAMISELSEVLDEVNFNGGRTNDLSTPRPCRTSWLMCFTSLSACACGQE